MATIRIAFSDKQIVECLEQIAAAKAEIGGLDNVATAIESSERILTWLHYAVAEYDAWRS